MTKKRYPTKERWIRGRDVHEMLDCIWVHREPRSTRWQVTLDLSLLNHTAFHEAITGMRPDGTEYRFESSSPSRTMPDHYYLRFSICRPSLKHLITLLRKLIRNSPGKRTA